MSKEKLLELWQAIAHKCSKQGLVSWLEIYDLTEEDWCWLENKIHEIANGLDKC